MTQYSSKLMILVLALAVLASPVAFAQITGEIRGVVLDPSGAAIPNAKITLTSKETGATRQVTSDEEGRFALPLLPIGEYEVKAEAPAFRIAVTPAIVRSGEISTVRFALEVGQVTESVVVTDAVSALDTENAQVQYSIEGEKIQEFPVGRNPNLFATIAPGVIPVTEANPFLGSGSYNSNGSRGRANNITVDNVTSTDISVTGTGGPLSPLNFSQIKEVKLITNNFTAEYGRNSGSQLQYITRSGTNEFHGELYEYFQNDKLNARPFFDRTGKANIVRNNQYGGVAGLPIIKNKLFFFGTYEGVKERGAGAARIARVPTAAMLAQVTDPTSRALLQQYQLPAATSSEADFGTLQQSAATTSDTHQFSFRGDWNIGDSDRLWGRYSEFRSEAGSSGLTFIGTNLANFGATSTNRPIQANLSWNRVFSPSVVNQATFSFGRSRPAFPINTTVPIGPRISFQNAQISSFGVWEGLPQGRTQNTYQWTDIVTVVRGSHNFKFGGDVFRYQANSFFDALVRPVFQFANWADFAAGRPIVYQQRIGGSVRGNRVTNMFGFAQDDWKVSRSFTLNLGVRLEVAGGPSEVNGLISNLDTGCRDAIGVAGSGPLGCFILGQPSFGTNWNWGPRVGFAWNVGGNQKTVVRGGYGVAYDFVYLNPITNQRFLPPFMITASIVGTSQFTGANSFANLLAGTSQIQRETREQVGQISQTVRNFGTVSPMIDRDLSNPQTHQWSLELQQELFYGWVAKARYLGTKSNYLQRSSMVNPINPALVRPASSLADETARLQEFLSIQSGSTGSAARTSNRIDPRFNDNLLVDSSANSNYHSLQAEIQKRLGPTFFFQGSYTWSKSIDDASDALGVLINDNQLQQSPFNYRLDRAPSQFDIRHKLSLVHDWRPAWGRSIGNGVLRQIVSGWGFAGVSQFRTGYPVQFLAGPRRGITNIPLFGYNGAPVRPNAAGAFEFDPRPSGSAGAPGGLNSDPVTRISTYAASLGLSQPLIGNVGNLGRNVHRLNGFVNFDWNVYKDFRITEGVKLQFRSEFYNVFNNVNFQEVSRTITSPSFGQYETVANDARNIQLGLRLVW